MPDPLAQIIGAFCTFGGLRMENVKAYLVNENKVMCVGRRNTMTEEFDHVPFDHDPLTSE